MSPYIIAGLPLKFNNTELLDFQNVVSKYLMVSMDDICKKNRKSEIIKARSFIIKYSHDFMNIPLRKIVDFLSPAITHHSTIIHVCKKMDGLMEFDKEYQKDYAMLLSMYRELKNKNDDNYAMFMKRSDKIILNSLGRAL